jgi:para-nitrobenzyl esterase
VAFSLLVSDASFACPALQVDRAAAARGVPTYAYQFNDDNAPVSSARPAAQQRGGRLAGQRAGTVR